MQPRPGSPFSGAQMNVKPWFSLALDFLERRQRAREPRSEYLTYIQPALWRGQPQGTRALPSELDAPDGTPPTRAYTVYPFSKIQPLCSVYAVKDLEPCLAHKLIKNVAD